MCQQEATICHCGQAESAHAWTEQVASSSPGSNKQSSHEPFITAAAIIISMDFPVAKIAKIVEVGTSIPITHLRSPFPSPSLPVNVCDPNITHKYEVSGISAKEGMGCSLQLQVTTNF